MKTKQQTINNCVFAVILTIAGAAQADTMLSPSDFSYVAGASTSESYGGGLNAAWNDATGQLTVDGSFGFNNVTSNKSYFDLFHQPTLKNWTAVTGVKFNVTVETTNVGTATDIFSALVTMFDPNSALGASNTIDNTWPYLKDGSAGHSGISVDGNEHSYFPGLRFYARLDNGGDGVDLFNDEDLSWGAQILDVTKAGGPTTFGDYPVTTYTFEMLFDNVQDSKLLPDGTFSWIQQNGNVVTTSANIARRYHTPNMYPLMPAAESYGSIYQRDNVESLRISTFFKSGKWIGSDEQISVTLSDISLLGGAPIPEPATLALLLFGGLLGLLDRRKKA